MIKVQGEMRRAHGWGMKVEVRFLTPHAICL